MPSSFSEAATIYKSGLIKYTIADRVNKGYGATTTILSILKEIPLAHWRVEAGLRLREALFINGTLFNSEAWQGLTEDDLKNLEKVDESLLRGICGAHSKIPIESLFLETGAIPIRFVIKNRRLSYLKTIINRDPDELIREVYDAQKADTTPGDYAELVQKDAIEISLDIKDENEIKAMKMDNYKTKVKGKIREAALKYLNNLKSKHTKMQNLKYDKLELAKYMVSPLFDHEDVKLLLALRTRTVRGIKTDFRGMFVDADCPLGCAHQDTIPNILTCPVIIAHRKSNNAALGSIQYEDIFSSDIVKQKQVTALYREHLDIRETVQNSLPVATLTGLMH